MGILYKVTVNMPRNILLKYRTVTNALIAARRRIRNESLVFIDASAFIGGR